MKPHKTVLLLDIDNTLLNNDAVIQQLRRHLRRSHGPEAEKRYIRIFEQLRSREGYADYLGALQLYRLQHPEDPYILKMSTFLIDFPFNKYLYPGAIKTILACSRIGQVVILSDGDAVFQPHKAVVSGIWKAAKGHVLIFVHKEEMCREVERLYPASHYILVDDKLRILMAMKRILKERLTTVFVRQGHYALEASAKHRTIPVDICISHIRKLPQALQEYRQNISSDN